MSLSSKSSTTSSWPFLAARCSAVAPLPARVSTSHPALIKRLTTLTCPLEHATCNALLSQSSCASKFAPLLIKSFTISTLPLAAATSNGVVESSSDFGSFTFAPSSRSSRASTTSPLATAACSAPASFARAAFFFNIFFDGSLSIPNISSAVFSFGASASSSESAFLGLGGGLSHE